MGLNFYNRVLQYSITDVNETEKHGYNVVQPPKTPGNSQCWEMHCNKTKSTLEYLSEPHPKPLIPPRNSFKLLRAITCREHSQ